MDIDRCTSKEKAVYLLVDGNHELVIDGNVQEKLNPVSIITEQIVTTFLSIYIYISQNSYEFWTLCM